MSDQYEDQEFNSEQRKKDHIGLALDAQVKENLLDGRFYYEPMLSGHPSDFSHLSTEFMGHGFDLPMWVSSMTGGTEKAKHINKNLAQLCKEYNIGMGLGSCRMLLTSDLYLDDFNVRPLMAGRPLFANLGVAQIEQILSVSGVDLIDKLVLKLKADGLIVHVNPLQEWLQPEGDKYKRSPVDLLSELLEKVHYPIIVKEVGQGFGKASLEALLQLPLAAIDFGASGGTNFALLELLRADDNVKEFYKPLVYLGHSANEMVELLNDISASQVPKCKNIIISGGVSNFLDGYYLTKKCKLNAIYAQASGFLKHALNGYDELQSYMEAQRNGLAVANNFLKLKI